MSNKKIELECAVYKSQKKDETFIFIPASTPLSELPEELLKLLGEAEMLMTLILTPDKKMARGTAKEIMESIKEQGFYLQMPIKAEIDMNPLPTTNERFLDKNL